MVDAYNLFDHDDRLRYKTSDDYVFVIEIHKAHKPRKG